MARKKKPATKEKQPDAIPPGFELLHTLRRHENRIWRLDYNVILGEEFAPKSVRYTTAKIVARRRP